MSRANFTCILFALLMALKGLAQLSAQPTIPGYSYHPLSEDKASWQRLNLWQGATFLVVAKEGQADLDSCLYRASRSMGVSRFSILAEGIDDPELFEQSNWIDKMEPAKGIHLLSAARGKKHVELLVLLGAYYAFQPGSYHRYRDSAEFFLTRAIHESGSLKVEKPGRQALALLVKVYAGGNDKKADSVCDALVDQCRLAGDKETEARVLVYRSKYTPPMPSTIEKKINDIQKAATIYHSVGDTEGEIHALTDLGYLQLIVGQLQVAYENLLSALNLAEAIRYPYIHYNTQALATATIFQGKFGDPLRYTYQTVRAAEGTRDSLAWSNFYAGQAHMFGLEGRSKESFEWAQKSVARFVMDRNTSVYRILNQVVSYMCEEGRPKEAMDFVLDISNKVGYPTTFSDQYSYHHAFSNCYLALKLPDQAEIHIKKMDSLETKAEAVRGRMRRAEVNGQFAQLFIERKQYRKARELIEKQFAFPAGFDGTLGSNMPAYTQLIFIDSILGDNAAAVAHYKKYTALLDSSFRISRTRQAEELQVIYQTNEKDNQINLLMQQAKLEKANSENAALLRNFSIAGVVAAMIIAGLLYRQNKLRKRNNQVITVKNEQLQQLLADKEWLLKEIHHRVKNNLQIVISLLDSQSEYINNEAAIAAIEDNMRRVHAMALIHQKLYLSDDVSSIAMPEYINELVRYTCDSFDTGNRIVFRQEIEQLDLDVSQAIPLGLIINESIVNSLKYAFPERKGTVSIELYRDKADHLVLKVSDNGTGLPEGFNTKAHTSLGLDLMQGLSKQLNGNFNIESNNGLHITIRFIALRNHFSNNHLVNF